MQSVVKIGLLNFTPLGNITPIEVLATVLKIQTLYNMTSCRLVFNKRRFGGPFYVYNPGPRISTFSWYHCYQYYQKTAQSKSVRFKTRTSTTVTTILMTMVLMTDPDTVRKSYGDKWNGMQLKKLFTSQKL
jgi:hypothetical protein